MYFGYDNCHCAVVRPDGLRGPPHLEKVERYAEERLRNVRFGPDDAFIVISTSGIRPLIVEIAGAMARGLPVVAIVSKARCEHSAPACSSGRKLVDIADVMLDNHCPPGDCITEPDRLAWRTGPVSTITGAMLINMLRVEVAERRLARGITPEVLSSHPFVGNRSADEQPDRFYEAYRMSLAHLYR